MKKVFVFILFIFLCVNPVTLAEDTFLDEIDLNKYLNDFNVQTYNTKKNERFKVVGSKDYQPREKTTYRDGDFSLNLKAGNMKDSKILLDGVEQKSSLDFDKKHFGFSTGAYSSYTRENARHATREVFFTPKYKYNDRLSVELNNYIDTQGEYFDQELGFRYKTKYLKNGSIGLFGGTKFYKDSTRSEKLKFSTEFYLF